MRSLRLPRTAPAIFSCFHAPAPQRPQLPSLCRPTCYRKSFIIIVAHADMLYPHCQSSAHLLLVGLPTTSLRYLMEPVATVLRNFMLARHVHTLTGQWRRVRTFFRSCRLAYCYHGTFTRKAGGSRFGYSQGFRRESQYPCGSTTLAPFHLKAVIHQVPTLLLPRISGSWSYGGERGG
jgi:hypothetical protein